MMLTQEPECKKLQHYFQTNTATIHHFYLYGRISNKIEEYADLINVLKTASEHDTVIIYINSEGGVLRMALQIANSMLNSRARVITSLDGEAMSAATIIFLAGHEHVINPHCSFMIHFYSAGAYGKGHELLSRVTFDNDSTEKLMRDMYKHILTDEEIESVVSGGDIYMDSDELIERLGANAKLPEDISESVVEATKSKPKAQKKKKVTTKKKKTTAKKKE